MKHIEIPASYKSALSLRDTQRAIKLTKDTVQVLLGAALNLDRVTAPVLVEANSGINDDLTGVERKVVFSLKETNSDVEVVQSLAKWKRMALAKYGYEVGEGIYTDMNAIRRDDDMDNLHSVFVDQWDWEKVISADQRTDAYLEDVVRRIVASIVSTKQIVNKAYPALRTTLCENVTFITSEELRALYPDMSGHEREEAIVKKYRTVFIKQIGAPLSDGKPHDNRAPDYDDWSLNGDLFFWDEVLQRPIEISSMGIRVDTASLAAQLKASGKEERMQYPYHQAVANGTLPLSIGGGIGQSRLCLLILEKAHVGEVQVSVWDEATKKACEKAGVSLL